MKRITLLFVFLLSWLVVPANAQTYAITPGTRVALSDLVVGNNYVIFSTAVNSSDLSALSWAGYVYDTGSAFKMRRPGELPKDHTSASDEVWTLMAKEGSTVTFKNVSTGRYISSNTSSPLSSEEASVKFYEYSSLPSGVNKAGSDVSSVSDDGTSSINCANGDLSGTNVYGIVNTDETKGLRMLPGTSVVEYASFCYPFTVYQASELATVTFNYVKDGVTYYTTTDNSVSLGDTYTFLVPNAYKGYAITSATDGTNTATVGNNLSFTTTSGGNTITVTLGQQNSIRDFKEITTDLTLTEITSIDDISEGQQIVMQINRGGNWGYMYWQHQDNEIGKEATLSEEPENVFVITKAVANQDGTKTVQIMGKAGYFFPTLSDNVAITMSTTPADYTLSRNTDNFFHLKNGNRGVDNNDGYGVGKISAWDYGETAGNQQIRIYSVDEAFNSLTISSIPVDVLGNNVTNGGKYAIRMPGRANGSNVTPNRYLTGTSGDNHIVQKEIPFDASMVWTLGYAPEGLTLKSDNNGNYASILNNYSNGADKNFLTSSSADDAEVWFPTTQTITANSKKYNGYVLKTTSGNKASNYLSNHGGAGVANMGFWNDATDNGSVFQFVPVYDVNFVDENGDPVSTTLNGVASAAGEFVVPHRGYYTYSTVIFPELTGITTLEHTYFDINGTEWDFQGLCDALAKVTGNMTITVKTNQIDYTATGALTRINDKNYDKVVTGSRYFLKMRQNASGTTDAAIDANVAYQTKNASGQIAPLAWNGDVAQTWHPYGTLKNIVLKNGDNTYLKVVDYPTSGIGYGTSFGFDATLANATPFSAWPCDATLLRYYLTTSKLDGSIYQYTSDVVNSANTAGLNTEIVTTDVGEKIQFVPAIKLSFVVKDANGDEMTDASITYNGVTFDNTTMKAIYVEKGKGFSSLTITEVSGDNIGTHNFDAGYYTYLVGSANMKPNRLSGTISTLTGDATIYIQRKALTGYEVEGLRDVNGEVVQSNQIYRLQLVARTNTSKQQNSQDYYLTQVHNSDSLMASNAIIGNGKQHWYAQPSITAGKIQLFAANETGYVGNSADATGNAYGEAAVVANALDFAYTSVGDESSNEWVYTLKASVNGADTYLGNPTGVNKKIGFWQSGGNICQFSFIPVGLAYGVFGQEITNGKYRIELPGRATNTSGPVTLTMNGGVGRAANLSDREQYYLNPQRMEDYRRYYWLSEIDDNVKYRNDSTQVWEFEFNGIAGVWIKNINGKYLKAESFEAGARMITDTVSRRENATLWAIRPVAISGKTNTYNLIAANDTIDTPTNWYLSNSGGGNNNMGFYNSATDGGSYFTFTPVRKISRAEAYSQGIVNGYGYTCYGLGYKNMTYAPGDNRDSIQGYMLPENLWLPYNPMSNSFSTVTFHQPDLIGYNYDNGITEPNQSDHVIRYTCYEIDNYPIESSDAPTKVNGQWTFDENTHWYAITVRACDGDANPYVMRQDFWRYDQLSDINTPFCDRYLWCFVGDSISGYLVYNKAEGAGRYMGSVNEDHIATTGIHNITWLPNDNSDAVKLYSKHLFQITQHTQSGHYMLMDRYSNLSFDAYNTGPHYGFSNYWHSRHQSNGAYIKNVLGTEEWTGGQTFQAASYEPSIYHVGGSFYARTMTFPRLTDIYKQTFTPAYFNGFVGFVGMHENTDSVDLNFRRLNANLASIGTVNPADYNTTAAFKAALAHAQSDSLAAYDIFLENLYENGVKYDVHKAYRLVNEKTGQWLSVSGDNNDGPITLKGVANFSEDTDPGSLWKFIEVDDAHPADNHTMNNKIYKMHNIYRSANLNIANDGTITLVREPYANRSSYGHDSGIGTNIDFVNDMVYMQSWGEFVFKPAAAPITGSGTGLLLSSNESNSFSTGYDLGDNDVAARWFMKGFSLDSISLTMPTTGSSEASQVYSSAVDPDNDFTWPYEHGLSAWRMTWRHGDVIRGQKITPNTSTDRPFIHAGTGILFRGPKGVKFPLLPCSSTTAISSLLVSPDETVEKDTIGGVPGFKLPAGSGFVIDYANSEDVVRCCLIGSAGYTSSNYIALDDGYVFLPKTKPYIPNDGDHYGSENYTLELEDEFGNVTKIGTVDTNGNVNLNDDNTFIDLQGRRVTQPVKGQIYIHKGQKIYFK